MENLFNVVILPGHKMNTWNTSSLQKTLKDSINKKEEKTTTGIACTCPEKVK